MPLIILFILSSFLFIYLELSLLVWIGSHIGIIGLILLLILSSFVGLLMIRARGWYTLFNVQKQLAQGEIPARSLLKSGIWIVAGALFFIPGFLTDILAILLLIPAVQRLFEQFILNKVRFFSAKFSANSHRTFYRQNGQEGEVFEAEYEKQVDDDKRIK
ncbi:FxsA family protein [Conservatibacter flavescens]|uniref:Membrane protein FxsA n=1 Tax=Conservatibacter flavescens TaxID=28161 RepID=A0A2M8S255_9PAST|nr:FxsA family protein [Conservatibacter flavescens]PJG85241.1 membrane protein FxsA [Conservatibacter flavescens]